MGPIYRGTPCRYSRGVFQALATTGIVEVVTSVRRTPTADIRLVLSSATTTLALLVHDGQLPEVIHWGVRLDDLDAETFDCVATTVLHRVSGDGLPNQPSSST